MRALIQRVNSAEVHIDTQSVGKIDHGLLLLLGVMQGDTEQDADSLLDKIIHLRIFNDAAGKMNHSLHDVQGALLVVSQFTLAANCRKGRRPSYTDAAEPQHAEALYEYFIQQAQSQHIPTRTGQFAAHMQISLTNDGPVTIWLDTDEL